MPKQEDEKTPDPIPNITMVGMVVAIVVSAVICFFIGLIVHNLYRKHRKKRVSVTLNRNTMYYYLSVSFLFIEGILYSFTALTALMTHFNQTVLLF